MLLTTFAALGVSIPLAHAWMPWDHALPAFNASARRSASNRSTKRTLPDFDKIRGVNLGAWLISEPFFMGNEWTDTMGCGSAKSEWGCMVDYGDNVDGANTAFKNHYNSWITPDDVQSIHDVGLNSIRIPIGFWSNKDLVNDDEYYPDGDNQLPALDAVVSKAKDLGMFVIMDLHGAPGAQEPKQPFTGRYASSPMFFQQDNYDRATKWLSWMTNRIHTTKGYENVGIIEVLNEPLSDHDAGGRSQAEKDTLTQNYYPQALKAIRAAEAALNIPQENQLTVQYMDKQWLSGNPTTHLPSDPSIAFDDHNYYTYDIHDDPSSVHQADLLAYTCYTDDRTSDGETPKAVQEWALVVDSQYNQNEFDPQSNKQFYSNWFAAQQQLYEKTDGWLFWTWKTVNIDYVWTYSYGTYLGVIPDSADGLDASASSNVCSQSRVMAAKARLQNSTSIKAPKSSGHRRWKAME